MRGEATDIYNQIWENESPPAFLEFKYNRPLFMEHPALEKEPCHKKVQHSPYVDKRKESWKA